MFFYMQETLTRLYLYIVDKDCCLLSVVIKKSSTEICRAFSPFNE